MSKLKTLKYITIRYDNNKRRIYLNVEKIPTKVANGSAEYCSQENASNCNHNINSNKYKKKYNKRTEIIPYWMEHPEVCVSKPLSEEEQVEMDELFKEFK